jgi:hypothetical protein
VWFNPSTGEPKVLTPVQSPEWTSPPASPDHDWALLLQKN